MRPTGFDGGESPSSAGRLSPGAGESGREPGDGAYLAEAVFPELAEWRPILAELSIPLRTAAGIAVRARAEGVDFHSALRASQIVSRLALLRAVANELGLGVIESIDSDRLVVSDEHTIVLLRRRGGHVPVKFMDRGGGVAFLITPERLQLSTMRQRISMRPALARHLRMVDEQTLRAAVLRRAQPLLGRTATLGLFERFPALSARIVANAWQGSVVGVLLTVLPVGLFIARDALLAGMHVAATVFFLSCVALRFAAVLSIRAHKGRLPRAMPKGEKPVYSVLVALYQEAGVVPDLLAALDRLEWPRDRLDIKLVCEADDALTLAALQACNLPAHVEVVEVPATGPRTKPKALAYALQMAGGEFVALYDAEDDPHPMQLVEAWLRFRDGGPELAAVQAPLEISNRSGFIARMFAFEYAGLFRGVLPWLSLRRLMLPLGGTSNHFRRNVLEEVGGWDPYNVTEDADLGMRLARFGYRTEVISCPTLEPAPRHLKVWLPQRTRWFKGWAHPYFFCDQIDI